MNMSMTKTGFVRRGLICALALLCAFALLGAAWAVPALAGSEEYVAKDAPTSGQGTYTTVEGAWEALNSGRDIIMLKDWSISSSLVLTDTAKEHTLYMNGCVINAAGIKSANAGSPAIELKAGARLNISGGDGTGDSVEATKTCNIFKKTGEGAYSSANTESITSGGFITNGRGDGYAGAVQMGAGATLTLDNIAIVGSYAVKNGGAVCMGGDGCKLYMRNKALIKGNLALEGGGGVFVSGDSCSLELSGGSKIDGNIAKYSGGGIYVSGDNVVIDLKGSSAVSGNLADTYQGGGVYEGGTAFTLKSSDETGVIEKNEAADHNGGGVYIADGSWSPKDNLIDGLKIRENTADSSGGGIYVNQRYVTIDSCEITKNKTTMLDGAGVYINRDYCVVKDSKIQENKTANQGGGVFCDSANDFSLEGTVIIKGNTRADDSKDDVFLDNGVLSDAYVSGDPNPASEIGIRTEEAEECKIGTASITNSLGFFSDFEGWHIERSAGDAVYLRKGTRYLLTVNGVKQALYNEGDTAYIFGENGDGTKVFYMWKAAEAGVALFDGNAYSKNSHFTMPAKDVSIDAMYKTRIMAADFRIVNPEGGILLPTEGSFSWTDPSSGEVKSINVPITWVYVDGDEKKTAAGTAEFDTGYVATAQIEQNIAEELVFSKDIMVTMMVSGRSDPQRAAAASVNAKNTLIIYNVDPIRTEKPEVSYIQPLSVSVKTGTLKTDFEAMLPTSATVTAEDGKTYTVPLSNAVVYPENSTILDSEQKVQRPGDIVRKALKLEDAGLKSGEETQYVSIYVYAIEEEPTAAPKATAEETTDRETGLKGMVVSLSCETEGATIMYKIDNGDSQEYKDSIILPGVKGEEKTYEITAVAAAKNGSSPSLVTFTYTVDNPLTVTVNKRITTGSGNTKKAYTAEYHKGDKVVIGAPSLGSGYLFEKWEDVQGATVADVTKNTFTVESIQDNIEVTAVYNPVLYDLDIELRSPVPGEKAADTLSKIIVNGNDWTKYFKGTVTWSPGMADGMALYSTAYTASIALDEEEDVTFAVSELLDISVNGGASGIQAAVVKESGVNYLRISFPTTDAEQKEDGRDDDDASPDVPYVPLEPDVTPAPTPDDTTDFDTCEKDGSCPIAKFTDAEPAAWYHDGLHYCLSEGIIQGVGENELAPDGTITRAQLVTILWRMEGEPAVSYAMTFSDVGADTWYTEAVRWAQAEGIVTGYTAEKFAPSDPVTREQLAAILHRYAKFKGMDVSVGEAEDLKGYSDASKISSYAVTPMKWAVAEGIITGTGEKTLSPLNTATRAQTACVIERLLSCN